MTWSEFNTAVRVHLVAHNRRQGIQDLIDTLIKAAVIDLQGAIQQLRDGHTTVYPPARFTTDGYAGKSYFTPGSFVTKAYARDPDDTSVQIPYRLVTEPEQRIAIVEGSVPHGERWIAVDSLKGEFRVFPNPKEDDSSVVLVWSGIKSDHEDDDETSFDDTVVLAAAEFVLARLSRVVDQDLDLARSYAGSYSMTKRRIKSDLNEASHLKK